jgi:hypothetical protein
MATASLAHAGTLTVVKNSGNGYVSSVPAGIDCGSDCTHSYPNVPGDNCPPRQTCTEPQTIALTAAAANGFAFQFWGGCDDYNGDTCEVQMSVDRTVHAQFADVQPPSVSLTAPGTGPVRGVVHLAATASDNDRVTRVQFLAGSTVLGDDMTAPYGIDADTRSAPFADGQQSVKAVAWDAAGHSVAAGRTLVVDNTAPTLTADYPPLSNMSMVFVQLGANEQVDGWTCTVDGAPWQCNGPGFLIDGLEDGHHTFAVAVSDVAGNPGFYTGSFDVDTTPPDIHLSGPDGAIHDTTATFEFSTDDAQVVTWRCALDGGPFNPCASPLTLGALGLGAHAVDIKAIDAADNQTIAHREFSVAPPTGSPTTTPPDTTPPDSTPQGPVGAPSDSTAPETAITKAPAKRTTKRRLRFEFNSSEQGSRFECSVDKAPYASCVSPLQLKVKPGKHTLSVRAIDAAGNVDATPAIAKVRVRPAR